MFSHMANIGKKKSFCMSQKKTTPFWQFSFNRAHSNVSNGPIFRLIKAKEDPLWLKDQSEAKIKKDDLALQGSAEKASATFIEIMVLSVDSWE